MIWEVRRIPLWPLAKVSFVVYFALSLVLLLLYGLFLGSLLSMFGSMFQEQFDLPSLTGGALLIAGLFMAIFASLIYTVLTVVGGLLYNAVASVVGGYEVELETTDIRPGYPGMVVAQQPPQPMPPGGFSPQPPPGPLVPPPGGVAPAPSGLQPLQPSAPSPSDPGPASGSSHERYMPREDGPERGTSGESGWGWGSGERGK